MADQPQAANLSWEEITTEDFNQTLDRYGSLIQAISDTKGAKHGQKTLAELDQYRYVTAPGLFGGERPKRPMELDDIKMLVDWKLRHGKFRPTLMKLVVSNDATAARNTVKDAIAQYRQTKDVSNAVEDLCKLRGVGPATASLLLAVHDPNSVMFFADEAFHWLCCGGRRDPIKYTLREYQSLQGALARLAARLGIRAVDVERVAFVLMKHQDATDFAAAVVGMDAGMDAAKGKLGPRSRPAVLRRKSSDEKKRKQSAGADSDGNAAPAPATVPPAVPAANGAGVSAAGVTDAVTEETGLRRSKRGKR